VETHRHVVVFDPGPRYTPETDAGSRVVLPFLRTRGIERVDVMIVSHLDSDHSGGTSSLLKGAEVGEVWTSIEPQHPVLRGARIVRRCLAGDAAAFDGVHLRVLHPTDVEYRLPARNTNARSCVVELRAGAAVVLLTGDLPAAQERDLVGRTANLRATVVMAPHHGSRYSSSEPFVRAVAPRWVFAQAGYRNRFGHPDPVVVGRYRALGAELLRTDYSGALQWRCTAAGECVVSSQRGEAVRYWHNRPASVEARSQSFEGAAAPREDDASEP
jgi:competence protein ComEC